MLRVSLRRRELAFVALLILAAVVTSRLYAAPPLSIRVTGRWQLRLDSKNLLGGAGSDLAGTYETAVNDTEITISKTAGVTSPWRLDVRRVDTTWDTAISVFVKRTSAGTGDDAGGSTVSDGLAYQEVTIADQEFFSGTGDRSRIGVQLKLEGVTAVLAADSYVTSIYYTVTEL